MRERMDYGLLLQQMKGFLETDRTFLPVLSNASALLMTSMEEINWAGFYLLRDGQLVLGPFQGRPACIHIAWGKGVCGTAAQEDRTLRVDNVHEFPGHIACDSASRSEIVVPIRDSGSQKAVGVLDIDSPVYSRFDEEDQKGLEAFVQLIEREMDWDVWKKEKAGGSGI